MENDGNKISSAFLPVNQQEELVVDVPAVHGSCGWCQPLVTVSLPLRRGDWQARGTWRFCDSQSEVLSRELKATCELGRTA